MHRYPKHLITLIECFRKLPGVGRKTAERFAFKVLDWKEKEISVFSDTLSKLVQSITKCSECGCLKEQTACHFCNKNDLDPILCIIASAKDVYPIEQTRFYHGYYHVLGSLISPLEGKSADDLNIDHLLSRIDALKIEEVILALDSTLAGDATCLYLQQHLKYRKIKISKLASGVPIGSSLEFIDEGTLSKALSCRQSI